MPLRSVCPDPEHHRKKVIIKELKYQEAFIKKFSKKLETIKKKLASKNILTIPTHVNSSTRKSQSQIKQLTKLNTKYTKGIRTLQSVQEYVAGLKEEFAQY